MIVIYMNDHTLVAVKPFKKTYIYDIVATLSSCLTSASSFPRSTCSSPRQTPYPAVYTPELHSQGWPTRRGHERLPTPWFSPAWEKKDGRVMFYSECSTIAEY